MDIARTQQHVDSARTNAIVLIVKARGTIVGNIPQKAVAGGATVGFTGALAHLLLAIWWPNADPAIAVDVTTIFAGIGAFLSVYLVKFEGSNQ